MVIFQTSREGSELFSDVVPVPRAVEFKMATGCKFLSLAASTRPRTYEKIQEEQRKILSSYYDKGMTTTGNNMQKTIEEAAAKTNLSIDRVKVMFACVLNI